MNSHLQRGKSAAATNQDALDFGVRKSESRAASRSGRAFSIISNMRKLRENRHNRVSPCRYCTLMLCALVVLQSSAVPIRIGPRKSPLDESLSRAERMVSCGDLAGAAKALEQASTNDSWTCFAVGDFYGTHSMLPTQRIERINWWMDIAYRLADKEGKRQIAGRCASGFGFGKYSYPKDDESTRLWLLRAADSGSAYWQCMLADAYVLPYWGFKRDGARALKYLEMAERQNHLKTHHVRANMYQEGIGLPKDLKKMMECLETGMKRGSKICRERYATHLINGLGGDDRRVEGCAILQKILSRGEANDPGYCLANLGFAYEQGLGVEKDIDKAVECYRQGAAHGNRYSQGRLKDLGRQ